MLSQDIRSKTKAVLADMHPFFIGSSVHIEEVSGSVDKVTVKGRFSPWILSIIRRFELTIDASNNLTELKITKNLS